PNLSAMMEKGLYGPLTSTIPPITVPAWMSMLTSKDPGQLGIYGFRNRRDYSYDPLYIPNSTQVRETALFQLLSRHRLTSILLGVPLTYPPRPLNGIMVSGFLTPDKSSLFTFPESVKNELDKAANGNYIIDVEDFRTDEKEQLLARIYDMTRARFQAANYLLTEKDWDFFMMVEMGVDRIHHGFWRYHDPAHRLHEPGHEYEHVIRDYYKDLDQKIGRLMEAAPPGTLIMIVSDHGARTMVGGFSINQWLIENGYLTLNKVPGIPARLAMDMIDWPHTKAWGEGGYYGRIFINVRGREPGGAVKPDDYERVRLEIKTGLENVPDNKGLPMGTRVFKPEQIYRKTRNIPPDLLVYFGDLAWRSAGSVGKNQPLYVFENDTGPDDANHAQDGLLIMAIKDENPPWPAGPRLGLEIYDVAPTVMDYFGLDVPEDMIGRVIR
ncbi:MAG: alkaline phosphatase family protein, partial [Deltaproteobacteria bacterium]|nr:alkaline phosphatase family protein [Deltaproteobacteria bacterium]